MIKVNDITVTDQFGSDYLYVKFSINDTIEDLSKFQFNIYRSNTPEEGFEIIDEGIIDFFYVDNDVNLYDTSIDYYYKIEIVDTTTNRKEMSDIIGTYKGREGDQYASYLVSVYNTYLDAAINNSEMILLPKKHFGNVCNDCYDEIRERCKNPNCMTCYGTRFVGGYFSPQKIKVSFFNSPALVEKFNLTDVGEDQTPIQFWTSNYPVIQINDILVDINNNRYIVVSWQPTYKNFYLVKQIVGIQRLPKSNVIYKIPVNN